MAENVQGRPPVSLVAQIHDELIFEVDTSQLSVEHVAQVRMLAVDAAGSPIEPGAPGLSGVETSWLSNTLEVVVWPRLGLPALHHCANSTAE